MKLPPIQRFQKQNYPGSPDWFTRFLSDVNQFTETVWNILNNNITPADNMDAQIYVLTIRAGATAAANTTSFETTIKHTPQALLVGQVYDQTAYAAALTSAVGLTWSFTQPNIKIAGISGLTNGHTYSITLVVL